MENLLNYSSSSSFKLFENNALQTVCFLVGLAYVLFKIAKFLQIIYVAVFVSEKDLLNRYGEDSYAVITGASDGIGKAFCFSLAKRGFNIVLIARNLAKLQKVENELKAKYPSRKTKIIVADFSESNKEGFFTNILDQLKNLDVSILINNVAVDPRDKLLDISEKTLKEAITVNCVSSVVLGKHFVEKFLAREKKSCIVSLSSAAGLFPMEYQQTYGGTKIFVDYFTRSVALEYPNIDVLSLSPGFVDTNMVKDFKLKLLMMQPHEYAEQALKHFGRDSVANGHWKHMLFVELCYLPPVWVLNLVLNVMNNWGEQSKKTN